jgi:hypothetical protein
VFAIGNAAAHLAFGWNRAPADRMLTELPGMTSSGDQHRPAPVGISPYRVQWRYPRRPSHPQWARRHGPSPLSSAAMTLAPFWLHGRLHRPFRSGLRAPVGEAAWHPQYFAPNLTYRCPTDIVGLGRGGHLPTTLPFL